MDTAAIAFIDILGFKGIWQRMPSNNVLETLEGVSEKITELYNKLPSTLTNDWNVSHPPEVTLLSDTIVIIIKSDQAQCIFLIADIVNRLLLELYNKNLFIRGAIGFGEYMQNSATFIGPAIDDVATWYEEANWIGVILTPSTGYKHDLFREYTYIIGNGNINITPYLKYNVPLKFGASYKIKALNWPNYFQAINDIYNETFDVRKKFEKKFSEQPSIDASVFQKY